MGYVIEDLAYDIILDDPWMRENDIIYNARQRFIRFGSPGGQIVKARGWDKFLPENQRCKLGFLRVTSGSARQILDVEFAWIATEALEEKNGDVRLFAASIAHINKAMEVKRRYTPLEIQNLLPNQIRGNAQYFTEDENHELPPH